MNVFYQLPGKPVSIVYGDVEFSVLVVPEGLPYWILPTSCIPADRKFRDAWQLDLLSIGEPSGYGVANDFNQ